MKAVRIEGQDWNITAVRESGNNLIVTVKGGQEIVTSGAVAKAVRAVFSKAELAAYSKVAVAPVKAVVAVSNVVAPAKAGAIPARKADWWRKKEKRS